MKVVCGGILLLAVAMGIGRFAYTPMLSFMQQSSGWSSSEAVIIAMSNYFGYFVGALLLSFLVISRKKEILILALFINVLTTFMMEFCNEFLLFCVIRFLSGISSAFIFILCSQIVLSYITRLQKSWWSGILYSGVGLGIVISSLILMFFSDLFIWRSIWKMLGYVSAVLSVLGILLMQHSSEEEIKTTKSPTLKKPIHWLIFAYGLEGLGYIITGTFIVAIAQEIPTLQWDATIIWLIVGIVAIPSCWVWVRLAEKYRYKHILAIALFVQAFGIVIPALIATKVGFLISAILFGLTFMGITTLANAIGREHDVQSLSRLTAVYGLGQMLGPMIAGKLLDQLHFSAAFVFAASCIVLASSIVMVYLFKERKMIYDI
ncbi:YbfB/YjiJ family MFS transporter [Lysinibacillus sp. NPDC096418]|uniref:YbfB/YjiJ family MFS transporter n=1 Tax=Lysinibacillus sp. NPDC096418 TaxID=3364138 RepID=UPI0037FE1795